MANKNAMEENYATDLNSTRIQGNDHSGIALVSAPLNGSNYLTWARSVKIALGARQKLGHIDGTYLKSVDDKNALEQWQKNDYMVVSWILDSISKEIAEAFLYANSTRDLWIDLETKFGASNGPLLYQIQREIASISQNMSVSVYFIKLKKLWDELESLDPLPVCSCGASKKMSERSNSSQLIQFLMGLSDCYDHVRNQVLIMDPLPSVGKAYSMVHTVEKQREIQSGIIAKEGVMAAQITKPRRQTTFKGGFKKGTIVDKSKLYCEHCKKKGHSNETCFELVGFPDWYRSLIDQRKGNNRPTNFKALNVRSEEGENNIGTDGSISDLIRKEVLKCFHDQSGGQQYSNFTDYQSFA
ncbi:UNVERIFIED_CONTAM: hypothetical protein Sindi_0026600, partial [Sesamum indicum]